MELKCKINGEEVTLRAEPTARLRDVLYRAGYRSVRDSDDAEGIAGSDTIVFNGKLKYANFILFYQAEGAEIRTAEDLLNGRELNNVQKAMVAAGIVQSAYNAPAAALILTWLLEQKPNPTREEIKDVLTSIFIRDAGYEHYYLAVKLATELRDFGEFRSEIAPSFRPRLEVVGKPCGKIDGAALVSGEPVFVEDKVPENAWCLHVLRSPFASAYIKSIDTSEAEKLPGVAAILTAYNTPETHYMQAGQGNPEPSPHDRRLFNRKVRHVGDRVAGIIARTPEIADQAAALIKVEYEPQGAVYTVEEAMAEGAPLVHNGEVIYNAGAPRTSRSTISSRATSARARSSTSSRWARTSIRTSRPPTRAASAIWKRASPRRTPSWSAPTRPARSSTRRSSRTSAMRTSRAGVWCSTAPRRCRTMCAASSAGCAAFRKIRSTSSRSVSAAATAASRTFWWRI